MFCENVIKKIPGEIVHNKKENQGYIEDLAKKSKYELEELLQRQNKLLANKFIDKLPDKGEKLIKFKAKLLKELEHRNQVDQAANLLSELNIASEGKAASTTLEWTGKYNENVITRKDVEVDSDDEEDVLKILAQPTGSGDHTRKITIVQTEESLIKPDDLEEIESFKNEQTTETKHINYIVDKVENPENNKQKEHFKPHKTTLSDVHDPMKEKVRKKCHHWEVTAATPPLIVHGAAKTLDLFESLKLQKEQADKLQKILVNHAIERLTQSVHQNGINDIPKSAGSYRLGSKDSESSSSDDEPEQEVYDEEDNDKAGTVVFTVDHIEI